MVSGADLGVRRNCLNSRGGSLCLSDLPLGITRYFNRWIKLPAASNREKDKGWVVGMKWKSLDVRQKTGKSAPRIEAWTSHQELQGEPKQETRTMASESPARQWARGSVQGDVQKRAFL